MCVVIGLVINIASYGLNISQGGAVIYSQIRNSTMYNRESSPRGITQPDQVLISQSDFP